MPLSIDAESRIRLFLEMMMELGAIKQIDSLTL